MFGRCRRRNACGKLSFEIGKLSASVPQRERPAEALGPRYMMRAALLIAAAILMIAARAPANESKTSDGSMPKEKDGSSWLTLPSGKSPLPPCSVAEWTQHPSAELSQFDLAAINTSQSESGATQFLSLDEGPGSCTGAGAARGHRCEFYVCANRCEPCICRFDQPGDCSCCTTDRYCRHCCSADLGHCRQVDENGNWLCDGACCDVFGLPASGPNAVARFGWWGVDTDGDLLKIGEYQDLESSPFWDIDGLWTDGMSTLDLTLTGLDNEATSARGYHYTPNLTTKLRYDRFLRRWDHDPLTGFDLNGPVAQGPDDRIVSEDLNVGEDYAIRVQRLDLRFQGRLTKNVKWKLNLWGMRKSGERQANATAHCFDINPAPGSQNNTCHVLSQRQTIDWTTLEIQPVVEARFGNAVVEYSRTMRQFGQSDQVVDRTYTRFDFSPSSGEGGPPFVYAFVPENFTQVDRLKISTPLNHVNQFYGNIYVGDTKNEFRGTHRTFYGYDLRVINRAIDDVTLTAYTKLDIQKNELPTEFLTSPPFGIGAGDPARFEPGSLRHPVDYNGIRFGVDSSWRPNRWDRLAVLGGYEYYELGRNFADYETLSGDFTQQDTKVHRINFGPRWKLSRSLNTYIRYKARFIEDPLIGVRENDGEFNTNQPEQDHRVEIGGTWMPSEYFMATALFGIENSWHDSEFANFDEDNYPVTVSLWYAPTKRWSFTGGYAYFSNWIDQDITIGFRQMPTETTEWSYSGTNHLFSIGANYAWTSSVQLVGGLEWNRGNNRFSVPASPAGADWSLLPSFSDVLVETTRINAGIDYRLGPMVDCYFRYVLFDYEDKSELFNSGTAHMFLAGVSAYR